MFFLSVSIPNRFFVQIRIYIILIQYKCNRGTAKRQGEARFSNLSSLL